jgi:type II secretion system protein N
MSRALRIASYLVFGLTLALLLTVWMFPYRALERRLEAEALQRYNVRMDIRDLRPALPLGCHFSHISVSLPGDSGTNIDAGEGSLRIKPWKLLSNTLGATLELHALEGEVDGEADLSPLLSPEDFDMSLEWRAVRLERVPGIGNLRNAKNIQGKASGDLSLRGSLNSILEARGKGRFAIRESSLKLDVPPAPVLPVRELRGEANWKLEERKLAVRGLQYRAKGLRGGLQGRIHLHRPLERSRLDLQGDLTVSRGMPQAYSLLRKYMERTDFSFRIRGSLGRPKTSLLN